MRALERSYCPGLGKTVMQTLGAAGVPVLDCRA